MPRMRQSTPIGFEVSFGRPLDGDDSSRWRARNRSRSIWAKGLTFRIAGRIDRIDQVGAALRGARLQDRRLLARQLEGHVQRRPSSAARAVGLAAVELLKTPYKNPKVTAGVYYFSSHKGRQERVTIPAPTRAAIAAVLGDLRELIVKGHFVRTPDAGRLQVLRLRGRVRRTR